MESPVLVCADRPVGAIDLVRLLRGEGLRAVSGGVGAGALAEVDHVAPALVLLTARHTSAGPVLRHCREVRERSDVPILAHLDRRTDEDELLAFANGADAFVAGSAGSRVLIAHAVALLRLSARAACATPWEQMSYGNLVLDPQTREVWVDGMEVHLTRIEFDLLSALMEGARRVVSRQQLLTQVWGPWHGDDHLVEVHLSRLRNKIMRLGGPRIGEPVPGVGYRLGRLGAVC